jgi:hypothetical protein
LGQIVEWYDREIPAGTEWRNEIDDNLNTADIILLLLSADFVASDYCWGVEMQRALGRHQKYYTRVFVVSLRPVLLDALPEPIASLPVVPVPPVTSWANQDQAFFEVAQAIREVVVNLLDVRLDRIFLNDPNLSETLKRDLNRILKEIYQEDEERRLGGQSWFEVSKLFQAMFNLAGRKILPNTPPLSPLPPDALKPFLVNKPSSRLYRIRKWLKLGF